MIAFLFSYSPFTKSVCNNFNNQRNLIWKNTDNRRSNNLIDHGIFNSNNILDKYIEFDLLIWFGNLFTNNQEEEEIEINENI